MVLSCGVPSCKKNMGKFKNHSFFELPKDPKTRQKWIEFIGKPNVKPTTRICIDHFEHKLIRKKHPRPLLVRGAVPTVLDINKIKSCSTQNPKTAQKIQEATSKQNDEIVNRNEANEANELSSFVMKKNTAINIEPEAVMQPADNGLSSHSSTNIENDKNQGSEAALSETPTKNPFLHPSESSISRLREASPGKQTSRSHIPHNMLLTPKSMRIHLQKRKIAALQSKITRLKYVTNGKTKDKTRLRSNIEDLISQSVQYLSKESQIMFEAQLRLACRKKYGKRYDKNLKDIALSILYHSPKTYKFMKKIMNLPSIRTLRRYQEDFPIYPGLNLTVLAELKDSFQNQSAAMKVVSLIFDEINLIPEIHFDASNDRFIGLADNGSIRQAEPAKSALVAMLVWQFKNLKQVIGYWLIGNRCTASDTYNLILPAVDKVYESGLVVKALICDQGPRNYGLLTLLGVTSKKTYFCRHSHKIYVMFDPPHLMKPLRNNLADAKLFYKGGVVNWEQIELVYKLSSQCPLNLLPKLTESHFTTKNNNFAKMRVSLATQVLSESMYTAILVYKTMFPEKFTTDNDITEQFVIDIDKVFDSLNSSLQRSTVPNKLNYAISLESPHIEFLETFLKNFETARFEKRHQPACIRGLLINVRAVMEMSIDLINNYGFKTVSTRRLNQDPLENLFAVIRQQHGCTTDPSPIQFQGGMRHILITNLSKVSSVTNCESDANVVFAKLSTIKNLKPAPVDSNNNVSQLTLTDQLAPSYFIDDSDTRDFTESNAIYYIAGYLCKKFLSSHKCLECDNLLILSDDVAYAEHKLFTIMKTYADTHGLVHVTETTFNALLTWERQYQRIIKQILHANNLTAVIANVLKDTCPQVRLCSEESSRIFMLTYCRIRCYWEARFIRRNLMQKQKSDGQQKKQINDKQKKMRKFIGKAL